MLPTLGNELGLCRSSENSTLSTRGRVYQHHLTKSIGRRIRIFDLKPAPSSSSNPIRGVLREISLEAGHRYDALSYVWGADKHNPACSIYLGQVTLPVTRNGHDALKRLRHTTRTRVVMDRRHLHRPVACRGEKPPGGYDARHI